MQPTRLNPRNLLDLVITSSSSLAQQLVSNVEVCNSHGMSDHCLIVFNLLARRSKPAPIQYTYRNIKGIDLTDFDSRLRSSALFTDPADSPDKYLTQFETTVTTILDQVAPLKIGRRVVEFTGAGTHYTRVHGP